MDIYTIPIPVYHHDGSSVCPVGVVPDSHLFLAMLVLLKYPAESRHCWLSKWGR